MTAEASEAVDLRLGLEQSPMSGAQVVAVAITVALSALDGYDVLAVTFAAPAIVRDWGIGKAALGVVLSSGLVGMAIGSLVLAPLADVIGRRRMVMIALVLMGVGSALSALADDLQQLSAWRVVTGLGIGIMVAVITPLAAEFSNARRRSLAVAAMAMGYPAAGVVGALTAAVLLRTYGWPAVFVVATVCAVLLFVAVAAFLPESPAYLLTRRGPQALQRLNALLTKFGQPALSALPLAASVRRTSYRALFAPELVAATLRLTLANLLFVMTVYYVLSWLPQMVADAGFEPSTASLVSAVANTAGIIGGVALGLAARRFGLRRLVMGAMVGLGLATAAFGFSPPSLPFLMIAAGVCGFFLFGGIAGLYATLATTFTAEARASGSGFVIGVGRAGSALGPYLAGTMFAAGLSRSGVSLAFAALAVLAGLALGLGAARERR